MLLRWHECLLASKCINIFEKISDRTALKKKKLSALLCICCTPMRSRTLKHTNSWGNVTQLWHFCTEAGTKHSWPASKIAVYDLKSLEQVLPMRPSAKPNNSIWKLLFTFCVGKKEDHTEGSSNKNGKGIKWVCNDELKSWKGRLSHK